MLLVLLGGCTINYMAGSCTKVSATMTLMDGSTQSQAQEQCR